MEATNTLDFCISCHEMKDNVYQEYKTTIHYSNRTGVRAYCSDCHVPKDWGHKMMRKIAGQPGTLRQGHGDDLHAREVRSQAPRTRDP
jgi:nitrate/TMAO reductase-like tetraheme cytochrome c subunit